MKTPTLTTARLVLDAPRVSDAPAWSEAQDDECARWFDWPCPPGDERCRAYLEELQDPPADEYVWAIRRDGALVGGIDLTLQEDGRWNISYFVEASARGQGIAREALRAVVDWGFSTRDVTAISTNVHVGNVASRRVLEAAGFRAVNSRYDADNEHGVVDYTMTNLPG